MDPAEEIKSLKARIRSLQTQLAAARRDRDTAVDAGLELMEIVRGCTHGCYEKAQVSAPRDGGAGEGAQAEGAGA